VTKHQTPNLRYKILRVRQYLSGTERGVKASAQDAAAIEAGDPYTPKPLNPYTPTPLHPYTPKSLNSQTLNPEP